VGSVTGVVGAGFLPKTEAEPKRFSPTPKLTEALSIRGVGP
jgi:hypothetical protein